jgi:hypothetical protein
MTWGFLNLHHNKRQVIQISNGSIALSGHQIAIVRLAHVTPATGARRRSDTQRPVAAR